MKSIRARLSATFEHRTKTFRDVVEIDYLERVLDELRRLEPLSFGEYEFRLCSSNGSEDPPMPIVLSDTAQKRVLIYLSEETGTVPTHLSKHFFAIFKCYLPTERANGNIFPFPLGYTNGPSEEEPLPPDKRSYDVFFSGNLNIHRWPLFAGFTNFRFAPRMHQSLERRLMERFHKTLPRRFDNAVGNSVIVFTNNWRSGFDLPTYTNFLLSSKIALCPKGWQSTETFRHYEAMRAGCIILTDRLPPTPFYKDAPFIVVNDWRGIKNVLKALLRDNARIQQLHERTLAWWRDRCSESAAALYMKNCLNTLRRESTPSAQA